MQSYWVTVSYEADVVLNHCFTVQNRDEAVAMMLDYLSLEFDVPRDASIRVKHH